MMTNELREKIRKDLCEGMSSAASVYWRTMFDVAEKYIDETDDDCDTFMSELTAMAAVEFEKAMTEECDKIIKSTEES